MRKKILIISTFFSPSLGGVETYTRELLIHINKKYPDNYDIHLLTLNTHNASTYQTENGYKVYRINCIKFPKINPLFINLKQLFHTINIIKLSEHDLVISQCRYYFLTNLLTFIAKWKKIPILHIEHNADFIRNSSILITFAAYIYDKILSSHILNRASRIIYISTAVKDFCTRQFNPKSTSCVITTGVELGLIDNYKAKKQAPISILYAGRLIKEKGLWNLLEVFTQLKRENITLHLAGDGPLYKDIEKWIMVNKYDNIHLYGKLGQKELFALYRDCNIYVYPSYYSEGLPRSIVEAGSHGMAIISTNIAGVEDIIKTSKQGIIIPKQDNKALYAALNSLISQPDLINSMGAEIKKTVINNFNWDHKVEKIHTIIQQISTK